MRAFWLSTGCFAFMYECNSADKSIATNENHRATSVLGTEYSPTNALFWDARPVCYHDQPFRSAPVSCVIADGPLIQRRCGQVYRDFLWTSYSPTPRKSAKYGGERVCMPVRPLAYLKTEMSVLTVDNAICYVIPALWITLYLPTVWRD